MAAALMLAMALPSFSFAATAPISAEAVYVEGNVEVVSFEEKRIVLVKLGHSFTEGDKIRTGRNGVVEIKFDNGDVIRVDKSTEMVVQSLHRNERGSTFSVFALAYGRVKSAVSKLISSESKFEYHTRAAICGVGGTPPWVVHVPRTRRHVMNVDLLGKKGQRGAVYVKGFDPRKTAVTLTAGTRTVVRSGMPPMKPFNISTMRRRNLEKTMPFRTPVKEEKNESGNNGETGKKEKAKEEEKNEQSAETQDEKQEEEVTAEESPGETDKDKENADSENGSGSAEENTDKPLDEQSAADASAEEAEGGSAETSGDASGEKGGDSTGKQIVADTISNRIANPKVADPDEAQTVESSTAKTSSSQGNIGQDATTSGQASAPPQAATVKVRINYK